MDKWALLRSSLIIIDVVLVQYQYRICCNFYQYLAHKKIFHQYVPENFWNCKTIGSLSEYEKGRFRMVRGKFRKYLEDVFQKKTKTRPISIRRSWPKRRKHLPKQPRLNKPILLKELSPVVKRRQEEAFGAISIPKIGSIGDRWRTWWRRWAAWPPRT